MKFSSVLIIIVSLFYFSGCNRVTEVDNIEDTLPPAQPQGLNVYSAYDGVIIIEWNANNETDITGYKIYRSINDTSSFKPLDTTPNDYYIDDSLDYNKEYFYRISAIDKTSMESRKSDIVSAKPINRYSPLSPSSVEINARNWDKKISIFTSWNQSEESDVVGYYIYRSDNTGFKTDSSTFIAFSPVNSFNDTTGLEFYKKYYYKIRALDKGGLLSDPSNEVTDVLFEVPEIIYPANNITTDYFQNFLIKAIKYPATYKIILQTNQYFDEIWSKEVYSTVQDDTIAILFDASYIYSGRKYFWRVATYSGYSSDPNSISDLYSFSIKK